MEVLLYFLQSIYPMSDELKEHLSVILKNKTLAKKEFLLKAGHVSRLICFIKTGLLRLYYVEGKKEVCTWFLKDGDVVISVESFFMQKESREYVQVLEETELWYISYDELLQAIKKFPESLFTAWILTQRYYILSEQKQRPLRMARATERYRYIFENFPELILRVPLNISPLT